MKYAQSISSIISNEFLKKLIDEKYEFKHAAKSEIIRIGINHTYLITVGDSKFILRVYTKGWRTEKEVLGEIELLSMLKLNQISVSYPIKDKEGKYLQKINAIEGERFAVLFSYSKGKTIKNPSKEICYNTGKEMARMHKVTIDKKIDRENYNIENLVSWAFESLKNRLSEKSQELEYVKKSKNLISSKIEEVSPNLLRKGIIHLDIWSDNIKVKEDTQIELFDFDNCGNGYLFLDIAYTILLLFKEESNKDIFMSKLKMFYNGYESISKISDEEKKMLPYGGLAIWLYYSGVHAQRFNDFSNRFFSKDFLRAWIRIIDNWMKFNKIKIL